MSTERKASWFWFIYIFACLSSAVLFFLILVSNQVQGLTPKVDYEIPKVVKPDSEISFHFDQPIRIEEVEKSFKITPYVKGEIIWENNFTSFKFVPQEIMEPGQKYVLAFNGESSLLVPFKAMHEIKIDKAPEIKTYSPFQGQGVTKDARIFVRFNKPVTNYFYDFKIEPEVEFDIDTDTDKTEFALVPKTELEGDKTYKVSIFQRYSAEKENNEPILIKEFSFSTLKPLGLITNYPKPGTRDVNLKQKVTLGFDKPIDLESFREYSELAPETLYQIKPSENNKTIVIQPEGFAADTDYKLTLRRGLRAQDGSYLEEDKVVYFKTGNKGGVVNDERRATDDPMIKDGKYIDINLSKQLLGIYSDGIHLGTYRVSSGKRGMNTPTGQYAVLRKERKHWSNKYKLWMPFSMQFTGAGHFIHELPEWPSGYKEGANHLGIPVSHGCVRLGVGPAETVFNFSEVGTGIYIHY